MKPTIDIILPCYNPLEDWAKTVVDSFQYIQQHFTEATLRLIIVNDGSTQTVKKEDVDFIHQHLSDFDYVDYTENKGKGYALRQGVKTSNADFTVFTDIDFPYKEASLMHLCRTLLQNEGDIIVGSRANTYYKKVPPIRKFISKTLRFFIRHLLRLPVTDTQCGLKGFNAKARHLFLETTINRYLFDLEFLFIAARQKDISIKPIDVELKDNVIFSKMNSSILFEEGINFLKIFLKRYW